MICKLTGRRYDALLIDLDGTLLDIDIGNFIPAYIEALSRSFAGFISRDDFAAHLFGATGVMLENEDPSMNNAAVFYEDFCRRIGYSYDQIRPVIETFYVQEFPGLSRWGKGHPHAGAVIEAAQSKGLTLVLATNPVYPATAVLQRLSWSGLSEREFRLVTTMENMHFCKPKPDYYLEISRKICCPPERCLMAGNDTLEDLSAARAGMGTFLVEDFILDRETGELPCDYRGNLEELAALIAESQ